MQKRLRAVANEPRPQVIFISVDAKRDTPAQLARYVPYFDPEFVGLTAADQPTIEAVARSMGVAVYIHEQAGGAYTVDHSAAVFVVDPAGRLSAVLTGPFSADTLRDDFRRIVAAGA
jgi:protein SCO1/2